MRGFRRRLKISEQKHIFFFSKNLKPQNLINHPRSLLIIKRYCGKLKKKLTQMHLDIVSII